MKKYSLFAILCIVYSQSATGQIQLAKKLIHKYLSNEKDTSRSPSFLPLPNISYAQETGFECGVTGLYSFYTDKKDSGIKNSIIETSFTYTEKKQSTAKILSEIWTKHNDYRLYGEIRYRNFPYYFYGLGSHTLEADKNLVNEKRFRMILAADKRVYKNYYIGLTAGYEYYKYADKAPGGIYGNMDLYGKEGGKYAYIGLEQFVDTRNTNTYTEKGQFAKLAVDYVPDFFGDENYKGAIIQADYRYFQPMGKNVILGFNGLYSSLSSHDVPFYLLQRIGSDAVMRGYYQGRYNDRNYAAIQSELRYRFVPRFGVVLFGGVGTVYGMEKFQSGNFKPNYGGGLRYFFDLERSMSVRIDYGFGQQVAGEKRQGGIYFSLGEAF